MTFIVVTTRGSIIFVPRLGPLSATVLTGSLTPTRAVRRSAISIFASSISRTAASEALATAQGAESTRAFVGGLATRVAALEPELAPEDDPAWLPPRPPPPPAP